MAGWTPALVGAGQILEPAPLQQPFDDARLSELQLAEVAVFRGVVVDIGNGFQLRRDVLDLSGYRHVMAVLTSATWQADRTLSGFLLSVNPTDGQVYDDPLNGLLYEAQFVSAMAPAVGSFQSNTLSFPRAQGWCALVWTNDEGDQIDMAATLDIYACSKVGT